MLNKQSGIALIEVLVAMIILGISVVGYTVIQMKATDLAISNLNKEKASTISVDFIQKIRSNVAAKNVYIAQMANESTQKQNSGINCYQNFCISSDKAKADVYETYLLASSNNMKMAIQTCPLTVFRNCLYIAWNETTPDNNANTGCMTSSGGGFEKRKNADCLVVETY